MRNPVCLLGMACFVPLLVVGVAGCQRDISDERLGRVITDLSQVPGASDPYELPDLGSGDEKTPAKPSEQDHAYGPGHPI